MSNKEEISFNKEIEELTVIEALSENHLVNLNKIMGSDLVKSITESFNRLNESILQSISPMMKLNDYFTSFIKIFKPIDVIGPIIGRIVESNKWIIPIVNKCKKIKKLYFRRLLRSYYLFLQNSSRNKDNHEKLLIVFSEFLLFIYSLFENYTYKIIKIFKNEPDFDLDKEKHFRREVHKEIANYYDLAELNFYKFYFYLNNIVNNIKHRDNKFYKRYENKSYIEILNESNLLFREMKEYIRNTILTLYFTRIRINYLVQTPEEHNMHFLSDFNLDALQD